MLVVLATTRTCPCSHWPRGPFAAALVSWHRCTMRRPMPSFSQLHHLPTPKETRSRWADSWQWDCVSYIFLFSCAFPILSHVYCICLMSCVLIGCWSLIWFPSGLGLCPLFVMPASVCVFFLFLFLRLCSCFPAPVFGTRLSINSLCLYWAPSVIFFS